MERQYQDILTDNLPEFVRVVDPSHLLPHLTCLSIPSMEEIDTRQRNDSRTEAAYTLYEHLIRKREGWRQLITALREEGQDELVERLESSVPAPAHQLTCPLSSSQAAPQPRHKLPVRPKYTLNTPWSDLDPRIYGILRKLEIQGPSDIGDLSSVLEFNIGDFETIKAEVPSGESVVMTLFTKWVSRMSNVTLGLVMSVVERMERLDVLDDLEKYFGVKYIKVPDVRAPLAMTEQMQGELYRTNGAQASGNNVIDHYNVPLQPVDTHSGNLVDTSSATAKWINEQNVEKHEGCKSERNILVVTPSCENDGRLYWKQINRTCHGDVTVVKLSAEFERKELDETQALLPNLSIIHNSNDKLEKLVKSKDTVCKILNDTSGMPTLQGELSSNATIKNNLDLSDLHNSNHPSSDDNNAEEIGGTGKNAEDLGSKVKDLTDTQDLESEVKGVTNAEDLGSKVEDVITTEDLRSEFKDETTAAEYLGSKLKGIRNAEDLGNEVEDVTNKEDIRSKLKDITTADDSTSDKCPMLRKKLEFYLQEKDTLSLQEIHDDVLALSVPNDLIESSGEIIISETDQQTSAYSGKTLPSAVIRDEKFNRLKNEEMGRMVNTTKDDLHFLKYFGGESMTTNSSFREDGQNVETFAATMIVVDGENEADIDRELHISDSSDAFKKRDNFIVAAGEQKSSEHSEEMTKMINVNETRTTADSCFRDYGHDVVRDSADRIEVNCENKANVKDDSLKVVQSSNSANITEDARHAQSKQVLETSRLSIAGVIVSLVNFAFDGMKV